MEAVLILTEQKTNIAREVLVRVATAHCFIGDEIRQAAVWGLGKMGAKSYSDLLPFLHDEDSDVALHAIAGFGEDASQPVIDALIRDLVSGEARRAPAASESLRLIGSDLVLNELIAATRATSLPSNWLLATLGRLPSAKVQKALSGDALLDRVAPVLLLANSTNWIADDAIDIDFKFLLKQNL